MYQNVIFIDIYQTLINADIGRSNEEVERKEAEGWRRFAEFFADSNPSIDSVALSKLIADRRRDFYVGKDKAIYHHNLLTIVRDVLEKEFAVQISDEQLLNALDEYRKTSRGSVSLYPSVAEVLAELSKQYTLAVASYTQRCFTQLELQELGIEGFFSYSIYTSDIGYRKAHPAFYEKCLSVVNKHAADCIMVGDNYHDDVVVPQQIGMKAIWVKNPATIARFEIEREPDNSIPIEEFENLPEVIAKLVHQ